MTSRTDWNAPRWYMPGSVLNALWGNLMPRLAAAAWLGHLTWPPATDPVEYSAEPCNGEPPGGEEPVLRAFPLNTPESDPKVQKALAAFHRQMVTVAFWERGDEEEPDPDELWKKIYDRYAKAAESRRGLSTSQRCALVVAEYFYPAGAPLDRRPPAANLMPLRIIEATGYDFVLTSEGLDIFVPPKPGTALNHGEAAFGKVTKEEEAAARRNVLQHYKHRETSKPPIGLPRAPATAFPSNGANDIDVLVTHPEEGYFINIPQLTAPTGAHQMPEAWVRSVGPEVGWWLSGSLYRGVMAAYPRIVASMWHEEVAWPSVDPSLGRRTYAERLCAKDGLRTLLQERVETVFPDKLAIPVPQAGLRPSWVTSANDAGWNPRDIMLTGEGIYFPDPGGAPQWKELAESIERGVAGNPVFTDSLPCHK